MTLVAPSGVTEAHAGQRSAASAGSVVVIGGGLAGMAAAVRLAQARRRVTLVEATPRLGGRATTYERGGSSFDNCQHVLLGCCTNLIDLFNRLGVSSLIEWHDTLYFLDRNGRRDVLRRSGLPAPFHLAPSMLKFRSLDWPAKRAIARALITALATPHDARQAWQELPFSAWLQRMKQPASAIDMFWDTVVVSGLNDTLDAVSTTAALQIFLQGFMAHRDGYRVGVPRVPLTRLYASAAAIIEAAGGRVELGRSARQLHHADGRMTGIELKCGKIVTAESYVCAMPPWRLAHLCDHALVASDIRFRYLDAMAYSPTISVRVTFDRRVTELPHAALLGSPLQWIFAEDVRDAAKQTLRLVASAAREWVDDSPEIIGRRACDLLARYVPAVASARALSVDVVKERRATFCPSPGLDAKRPKAAGTTANLFLAGDWCRTGWPATMEGAVRSGYLAAGAILGRDCVVPDLHRSRRFDIPVAAETEVVACP